jgi:hypothetical protein
MDMTIAPPNKSRKPRAGCHYFRPEGRSGSSTDLQDQCGQDKPVRFRWGRAAPRPGPCFAGPQNRAEFEAADRVRSELVFIKSTRHSTSDQPERAHPFRMGPGQFVQLNPDFPRGIRLLKGPDDAPVARRRSPSFLVTNETLTPNLSTRDADVWSGEPAMQVKSTSAMFRSCSAESAWCRNTWWP